MGHGTSGRGPFDPSIGLRDLRLRDLSRVSCLTVSCQFIGQILHQHEIKTCKNTKKEKKSIKWLRVCRKSVLLQLKNFESLWQNKTQNKQKKDLKT